MSPLLGAPLSLILVDVDFFKAYNDTYGHLAGDDCLSRVAERLRQSLRREGDVVARFGGEEFACILPSTSHAGALVVAERMRRSIIDLAIPHDTSSAAAIVTASFGVVTTKCSQKAGNSTLLALADKCLYAAKSRGRNGVVGSDVMLARKRAAAA